MLKPGKKFHAHPNTIGAVIISLVALATVPTTLLLTARADPHRAPDQNEAPEIVGNYTLPHGWSLDYDDGLRTDGGQVWPAGMAKDLSSLDFTPVGLGPADTSWQAERYDFEVQTTTGETLGDVHIRLDRPRDETGRMTLKPGKYLLRYTRGYGDPGDNFRVHSGPFTVDLAQPGMYELRFTPKQGNAQISGSLGGCYALNFDKTGDEGPNITGFVYLDPRLSKPYVIDGLPAGTYRLSAVTQDNRGNNLVSPAQATVKADEKLAVDIVPPPRGDCSLHGLIAGRRGTYWTPSPMPQQTDSQWFVLIRTRGSGPVEQAGVYEAQTMDSRYVIPGRNIVQDTQDRASYSISGIAPGEYTVTVIEHPWCKGLLIERQQSQPLTLRPGETATLDFDLGDPTTSRGDPSKS